MSESNIKTKLIQCCQQFQRPFLITEIPLLDQKELEQLNETHDLGEIKVIKFTKPSNIDAKIQVDYSQKIFKINTDIVQHYSNKKDELNDLKKEYEKILKLQQQMQKQKDYAYNNSLPQIKIKKLHQYNMNKDLCIFLIGKLATQKQQSVQEIFNQYNINFKD